MKLIVVMRKLISEYKGIKENGSDYEAGIREGIKVGFEKAIEVAQINPINTELLEKAEEMYSEMFLAGDVWSRNSDGESARNNAIEEGRIAILNAGGFKEDLRDAPLIIEELDTSGLDKKTRYKGEIDLNKLEDEKDDNEMTKGDVMYEDMVSK